jgi:SAM-dependent methyltransferase
VAGVAGNLPFAAQSFDAATAFSTIHHWPDPLAGLRELQRVARRVVVFTADLGDPDRFWLTRDYLPEFTSLPGCRALAAIPEVAEAIGARTEPLLVPWDCVDGFYEAYWRRPEAYLDEHVRRGISVFAALGPDVEARAVEQLADDLATGRWAERNRDLLDVDVLDLGIRLLVA